MPSDWERVEDDPALLDAARRAYAGGGELADQLRWLSRPGERGPSGAADPATALEDARRELYRAGADPGAGDRVAALEQRIRIDRDAAAAAVRAALAAAPPTTPGPAPSVRSPSVGVASVRSAAEAPPRAVGGVRRSGRVLIVVALVALLVGGGIGALLAASATRPSAAALSVFATRARADDAPSGAELPAALVRGSTRLLGASTTSGLRVYAARASDRRVCLLGVVPDARPIASCTTPEGFAAGGLQLLLLVDVDPENDSGVNPPRLIAPHWYPDGRFAF